jgi:hypothetical protein
MAFSRRGFLGRIFGARPFERACFAVQVVIEAGADLELRRRIHQAIESAEGESPAAKRKMYKALTAALGEAEPVFEYACYEYQDDEREADHSFRQWVSELEANMATEALETGEDVDGYKRMSADKKYIVVSLVFLLTQPHPWGVDLNDEDEDSYTRKYIGELIDSVNLLDFDNGVESDGVFLLPGSDEDGFSWEDLADEGWEHLVMLRHG